MAQTPLGESRRGVRAEEALPAKADNLSRAAEALIRKRNVGAAVPMLEQAVAILKGLPAQERALALNLILLGSAYSEIEQYQKSDRVLEQARRLYEERFHESGSDLVAVLTNLGGNAYNVGKHDKAERLLRRAEEILRRCCADDMIYYARVLNNLASVDAARKRCEPASAKLFQAIGLYESKLGPDDLELTYAYNNQANLLANCGDSKEAENLYRKALAVWDRAGAPPHHARAQLYGNYGALLTKLGRYEEAARLHHECIQILGSLGSNQSRVMAERLNDYADVLARLRRKEDAEHIRNRASAILADRPAQNESALTVDFKDLRAKAAKKPD